MYLVEVSQLPDKKTGVPRTVIIGAGAVGLYTAGQLAKRGRQVVLIEAGDSQLSSFSSDSWRSIGRSHSGIRLGRGRNLGGTTSLWGGQLVEFQPIDFAGRDWLPGSKWPVRYEELAPYYTPTYLNLGMSSKILKDDDVWRGVGTRQPNLGPDFEVFLTRWLGIPNFASLFAEQIHSDPNLLVVASHTAVGFSGNGARMERVRVVDNRNRQHTIEGDTFLLAAGTIENARLLLHAARDPQWLAPWRENKNVGLYFQDHLAGDLGAFHPADKRTFFRTFANIIHARHKFQPKIRMRNEVLVRERIYNIHGFFAFESEISEHMVFLKQFLRAALYTRKLTGVDDLFRKSTGIVRFLLPLMWKYVWDHRIFVPTTSKTRLVAQGEHAPSPSSRITIDNSFTEASGLPRVILDWRLGEDELPALRDFAVRLRDALRAAGIGELKLDEDLLTLNPAFLDRMGDIYHNSGGAIMGESDQDGVVDKNLRVFGTDNFYIGGASVFRTTSNANVTFTALAFATRLVDHLTGTPASDS